MKTKISQAIIIAASLFCTAGIHAQQQNTEAADTLERGLALSIEITTSGNQNLQGATVKIYQDKKFVAELSNKQQSNMKISLEKNKYFVMEVEKPGYISKSILVSTLLPESSENTIYQHNVLISLDKKLRNAPAAPLIGILYYDVRHDNYIGSPMKDNVPNKADIIAQLENWLGS